MKNLFFTAIALVAFSGVSLAGTISNKEVVKDKIESAKSEKKLLKTADPCQDVCHLAYNLAISEGATAASADAYADICYGNCIASQKL